MDAFFQLTPEERRSACNEFQSSIGIQAESVERDFWVCWTLRELFAKCILLHYPSAFSESDPGYISPQVKIELGARSDDWPHEQRPLQPYLAERFPQLMPEGPFSVQVLAAERTFWEKACLLHEETFRPTDKPRKHRSLQRLHGASLGDVDSSGSQAPHGFLLCPDLCIVVNGLISRS